MPGRPRNAASSCGKRPPKSATISCAQACRLRAVKDLFWCAGFYNLAFIHKHYLVCHAPGALVKVRAAYGQPLVAGRRVTGFTNSEEAAVGLSAVVPFLIEDEFIRLGGHYQKGPDWQAHVVTDGRLVTGQNPGSSEGVAQALLSLLARDVEAS